MLREGLGQTWDQDKESGCYRHARHPVYLISNLFKKGPMSQSHSPKGSQPGAVELSGLCLRSYVLTSVVAAPGDLRPAPYTRGQQDSRGPLPRLREKAPLVGGRARSCLSPFFFVGHSAN